MNQQNFYINKKLIQIISDDKLYDLLHQKPHTIYLGIDPTGNGIHIGHLIVIELLLQLLQAGNKIIILIGGFTGSVGDPTDKASVRKKIEKKYY